MDGIVLLQTPYYTARQYPLQNNRLVVQLSIGNITTDADASRHPADLALEFGAGRANPLEAADRNGLKLWKDKLGAYAAYHIVRPAVLARGQQWTGNAKRSTLLAFPPGYQLFSHRRGDGFTKDRYLCGSQHVKVFRSPEEFAAHLGWLMIGQPANASGRRGCRCIYCDSSVNQADVHQRCRFLLEKRKIAAQSRRSRGPRVSTSTRALTHSSIPYKDYSKLGQAAAGSKAQGLNLRVE